MGHPFELRQRAMCSGLQVGVGVSKRVEGRGALVLCVCSACACKGQMGIRSHGIQQLCWPQELARGTTLQSSKDAHTPVTRQPYHHQEHAVTFVAHLAHVDISGADAPVQQHAFDQQGRCHHTISILFTLCHTIISTAHLALVDKPGALLAGVLLHLLHRDQPNASRRHRLDCRWRRCCCCWGQTLRRQEGEAGAGFC